MLTKVQSDIFGVFRQNLFAELTFKDIKKLSSQNSNNIIQLAIDKFKKERLVNARKTGDVTTYSLNFDNNQALLYLSLINNINVQKIAIPHEVLREMQRKILQKTEFFIMLIFGSYAKKTASGKSDLDIAIIADSAGIKKEITPLIETVKRRSLVKIDYYIFTRNEFLEMLEADYENVGKQIYKNNVIYYGFVEYYNLIRGKKHE